MNLLILLTALSTGPAPHVTSVDVLMSSGATSSLQERQRPQRPARAPQRTNRGAAPRSTSNRTRTGRSAELGGARVGQGGHALDASLEVGSGGYNRPGRNSMHGARYGVGDSCALFRVGRGGDMVYDPNNAFTAVQRYSPTGWQRGGREARFRYHD